MSKPLSEYSKKNQKGRKEKLQPKCKSCATEETKQWRLSQSPERIKDLYYKRTYGMSLEDFNFMLWKQNGSCKICKRELKLNKLNGDSAVVDHCHSTGKVRGILCNECNRGLGYFKDDVNSLKEAIHYLKGE